MYTNKETLSARHPVFTTGSTCLCESKEDGPRGEHGVTGVLRKNA